MQNITILKRNRKAQRNLECITRGHTVKPPQLEITNGQKGQIGRTKTGNTTINVEKNTKRIKCGSNRRIAAHYGLYLLKTFPDTQ